MRFIVYGSTTCAPCKVALKRLDAANIPYEYHLLDEEPELLAELKHRLGLDQINTPHIEYGSHRGGIADLSSLIAIWKEKNGG